MAMRMHKIFLVILFCAYGTLFAQSGSVRVNFAHLDHLTETIALDGDSVEIVHIYANYPDYRWIDAKESGPEGIACVDDAARAAVVYFRHYEFTHDAASLAHGRALLNFIMKMETDDGEFYNFLHADHSVNRDGKTSFKSFGWWAARGVWSMSIGYRLLKDSDPRFAARLMNGIARALPHVEALLTKSGEVKTAGRFRIPQWLLYDSGADVTSELLLGLTEFYRATHDKGIATIIRKLSDGLMVMQDGDASTFPYGLHRSWETMWHAWGNSQSFALAYAGTELRDTAMIASAEREARSFYARLLIGGMFKEWDCAAPEGKVAYEQIAYGIRPMTLALLRLYDATGKKEYAKMAGLAASWLFGNNVLHQVMYDTATGRCFDGISDSAHVNRNSGAESTIEALYTLVEIERYPLAKKYLQYRKTNAVTRKHAIEGTFRSASGAVVTLTVDTGKGTLTIREGKSAK